MQHGLRAGSAVNHEQPVLRVRAGAGVPRPRRPGVRRLLVRAADVGDEVLAAHIGKRQAGSRGGAARAGSQSDVAVAARRVDNGLVPKHARAAESR